MTTDVECIDALADAVLQLPSDQRDRAITLLRAMVERPPPVELTSMEKLAWSLSSFPPDVAPEIAGALGQALELAARQLGYDDDKAYAAAMEAITAIARLAAVYGQAMAENGVAAKH